MLTEDAELQKRANAAEAVVARVEALLASWQAALCNDGCAFELDRALRPK